jgi:hypothetical protein
MIFQQAAKPSIAILLFMCAGACKGDGSPPSLSGEAPAAVMLMDDEAPADQAAAHAQAMRWMEDHLPKWQVYFVGSPFDAYDGGRVRMDPRAIDGCSALWAEEAQPHEGVEYHGTKFKLSTVQLRARGKEYLTGLVDRYGLDLLDIVVLSTLLDQPIEQIPAHPLSFQSEDYYSCTTDGFRYFEDSGGPLPGDWGPDNHTYGPGSGWSSSSSSSGAPAPSGPTQPPAPHPPFGHHPAGHDRTPAKLRSPNGDAGGYSARDVVNGLMPDDRPEGDYPGTNTVQCPAASQEVFKCQGHVYTGCKSMCPDYALGPSRRWADAWVKSWDLRDPRWAITPPNWMHDVWNDGKNPECTRSAKQVAALACFGGLSVLGLVCRAYAPCWATVTTVVTLRTCSKLTDPTHRSCGET